MAKASIQVFVAQEMSKPKVRRYDEEDSFQLQQWEDFDNCSPLADDLPLNEPQHDLDRGVTASEGVRD